MKHHFLKLAQVAFSSGQKAKNEFAIPVDPLKHRLLESSKSLLCPARSQKVFSHCKVTPGKSLFRYRPNHIYGLTEGAK